MSRRDGDLEMGWRREKTRCGIERCSGMGHRESHSHVWWIKIWRDTLGASDSSPRPDRTAQGSSAGKINPSNFWL